MSQDEWEVRIRKGGCFRRYVIAQPRRYIRPSDLGPLGCVLELRAVYNVVYYVVLQYAF